MKPFSGKGDLTQGPVKGHLLRLSIPMIWGIFSIVSFQLVDTYFISLLGTEELAAIGFTFPVTMTVLSLVIGLGIGTSSVLSRKIGAGSHEEIVRIATHALVLAALAGLIIAGAGLLFMKPIFRAMGAAEDMLPMITDFMGVWFAASIFFTIPIVGNSAIRATGDTFTPSMIMLGVAGLNVILNPLLIFGLFGLPALGIQGSAIGTVLSYFVAACAAFYILRYKQKLVFTGPFHGSKFGDSARQLLFIALPAGFVSIINPVTQGVLTSIIAGYGVHAVAAYGVATRVEAFAFITIMALATGMSPILGQNWGAKNYDRVRETLRLSLAFCVCWSVLMAAILGLFASPLARLFSEDPEVVHYAILYFWIVPFSYALGNLVQGWSSAFTALGHPKKSVAMIVTRTILLQIPLAFLGGRLFGAPGVFGAIALVNILTGLFFHARSWAFIKKAA